MSKETVINHNGKIIRVWFDDYHHGDQNLLRVSIDQGNISVILLDENITKEF
jgi:phosphopantetheine adenylyltransferase